MIDQIAKCLFEVTQAKCFDDLRIDLVVDEIDRCWLVCASSLDFIDLRPPEEYHESPNKEKFLKVIVEDQKR